MRLHRKQGNSHLCSSRRGFFRLNIFSTGRRWTPLQVEHQEKSLTRKKYSLPSISTPPINPILQHPQTHPKAHAFFSPPSPPSFFLFFLLLRLGPFWVARFP